MGSILLEYYFTLFEILVILFLIGGIGIVLYWGLRKRWQDQLKSLKQKHAEDLAKHDSEYFQTLHDHLKSAVAHEFLKDLDYISNRSEETLVGLGNDQHALRKKQKGIIAKVYKMDQHAENILNLFDDKEGNSLDTQFLDMRGLIEGVAIKELLPYAASRDVTLKANLEDMEPTPLNRDLTVIALKNVIHNAIRYSPSGGVVRIVLSVIATNPGTTEEMLCIEVTDAGKGIREEEQETIFELRKRGSGLIETGSGLGLFLSRRAARRQSGDVILVHSSLNQGSVFRIVLPYRGD